MWYYNYYVAIMILAIIFFFISNQKLSILIAIIIILIISYFYFNKINNYNDENKLNDKNIITAINHDIKERQYLIDENYFLKKFPNEIKYLQKDKELLNIIINIRFIKRYDSSKYTNIVFYIDKFYKIYMFILADRYDIKKYFSTFLLLRNTIIKELYSIYVILPLKMKYYYGFDSFNEINKSIKQFIDYSRKMITIIEKYGYQEKEIFYLDDTKYKPYENSCINEVY
jgi:hypothetical protein